jgi:hypothetical protein
MGIWALHERLTASGARPVRALEIQATFADMTLAAGAVCGSPFLTWIARNPLKSPESDEGIQENPSPFSWSGLDWLWFGLEEFGPGRYGVGRSLLARLSTRADEDRRRGRSGELRSPGNGAVTL